MGMSMSKAQAEAIADGFLDDLGSSPDAFEPKETFTEIILLAGQLVLDIQENLIRDQSIATGKLSESITALEPVLTGSVLSIDIVMNFYGKFINKGVRGVKNGTGGLYQFRFENPSKKMVIAIDEYLRRSRRSIRTVKKKTNYGENEKKNRNLAKLDDAYAFARKIKQVGIRPRHFLDDAVYETNKRLTARLGAALRIDVLNSIIE